ncbi:MAG: hypothetical protein WBO35_04220 [Candidatus Saccharimonadales bacterium]
MAVEQETKSVLKTSGEPEPKQENGVVSGGDGQPSRSYKVFAFAAALVLLAILGFFVLSAAKTTRDESAFKRDEAVKTAVAAISAQGGPDMSKLTPAVKTIDSLSEASTNYSAEYVATWYYVQVSDAKNARLHLNRLEAKDKSGQKIDAGLLAMTESISLKDLTDSVKFLEGHQSSGGVTGG